MEYAYNILPAVAAAHKAVLLVRSTMINLSNKHEMELKNMNELVTINAWIVVPPGIQFLSFHRLHICSDHQPLFVGPTVDRTNSFPRPRWANVKQLPAGQKDNSRSEFGSNRSPDAFSSSSIQFQEVTLSENVVIKPNSKGFSLFFHVEMRNNFTYSVCGIPALCATCCN